MSRVDWPSGGGISCGEVVAGLVAMLWRWGTYSSTEPDLWFEVAP